MTSVERPSESTQPETQNQLGELVEGVQTNLSILVSLALHKPRRDFTSDKEYTDYHNGLRYRCFEYDLPQTLANGSTELTPGFSLCAGHMEVVGQTGWNLGLFSPHVAMSPEGGLPSSRYIMQILQYDEAGRDPLQVVTVDCAAGIDDNGPRLKYWNPRGITGKEVIINSHDLGASYPFHVVSEIAEKIKREADALLSLALDDIAASSQG